MISVENQENQPELEARRQQTRTIVAKKVFLDYFQKTLGIVSVATQKTGIERTTVYLWRRTDPKFRNRMDETEADVLQSMEDALKLAVLKGSASSVHFWLSRRHPDYKISKCNHVTTIKNPYENLTENEKLEKLKNLVAHYGMILIRNPQISTNGQ